MKLTITNTQKAEGDYVVAKISCKKVMVVGLATVVYGISRRGENYSQLVKFCTNNDVDFDPSNDKIVMYISYADDGIAIITEG